MTSPQVLSSWVGHWTGTGTGVTVILPPPGTVGSGEVRGGAPATREFALLEPSRLVNRVDAVVLSGGSAYGLAAGHGVLSLLGERGTGFATPFGVVPIVVGMSLFDASIAARPPDAEAGRLAATAALSGEPLAPGAVGAGAGATTGKWRNRLDPGGVGWAARSAGAASVAAVVAVNAWGDVLGADGRPVFGADDRPVFGGAGGPGFGPGGGPGFGGDDGPVVGGGGLGFGGGPGVGGGAPAAGSIANTTIGVVLTDARLSKTDCYLLAQSGHTGYARALHPAHSRFDGDAVVALASGPIDGDLDLIRAVAAEVMADAIRAAVAR